MTLILLTLKQKSQGENGTFFFVVFMIITQK